MKTRLIALFAAAILCAFPAEPRAKKGNKPQRTKVETTGAVIGVVAGAGTESLWNDPSDIASRNLFYGPGGKKDQPRGRVAFVEEDLDGSNPKFVVRDEDGVKWKVKLGIEARPETAASRFVWAVGYHANEDYFVPKLMVDGLPRHLHRGQQYVSDDGVVRNARLKRYLKGEKKIGTWAWEENPFTGTTQLNGLRVLMGVLNNWDLKDENNAIYQEQTGEDAPERIYMISDLGASFGTGNLTWPLKKSRGNLKQYRHSKFLTAVREDSVSLRTPGRPWPLFWFLHAEYELRVSLLPLGKDIPRSDARWMGDLLARLSPEQIREAFRAAGYSPKQVEGFAAVVERRIAQLRQL